MSEEGVMPRQDLRARTKEFALRIVKMYMTLPKTDVARVLGQQVLRSGTSVGANYHEAFRARSKAEFVSKLGDCLKELEETSYWLELLSETSTIKASRLAALQNEADELIAIFTSIVKSAKSTRPNS